MPNTQYFLHGVTNCEIGPVSEDEILGNQLTN